jgi:hypothetical protein
VSLLLRARSRRLAAALLLPLAGCVPYTPTLYLEASPATIPVEVYVEELRDATPPEDREASSRASLAQTSASEMDGELAPLVTKAITADFSATGLFRSVASRPDRADLILRGTIRRFHGEVTLPPWMVLPGLSLAAQAFWGLAQQWEGDVELELVALSRDGHTLGAYRGLSRYEEVAAHDRHFWSMPFYPAHIRLNEAFTEAVRQIREQLLKDRERLAAQGGP